MNQIIDNLSPSEIFGLTIIGEARGESVNGQVAVGNVIKNRMLKAPYKYKSYKDVCLEKSQFSCWNLNDPNYTFLLDLGEKLIMGQFLGDIYLKQCMWIAKGIEQYNIADNTLGALNYMTDKLFNSPERPVWARYPKTDPLVIDHQVFFNV